MGSSADILENKMEQIHRLEACFSQKIINMNRELFQHASKFEEYYELYIFVKKHTKTQEEFNKAMFTCRDIFFNKEKKKEEERIWK
jgi:hypothetical protein